MAKRYTRKQLKQPDEFITYSMRTWEYIRSHLPYALLSLGVAAVIIAAVWTWSYFAEQRATKSTATLTSALEIYAQPIAAEEQAATKSEAGVPSFKTSAAKLEATEKELSKVVEQGGKLAAVARAMRAGVRYDAGKLQPAIEDYEAYLKESSISEFRLRAYEDLGYSYESLKQYDKALESFRRLAEAVENKPELVHYHEARILAKQGKAAEAKKLLRQVMDKSESPSLKSRAANQLLALEGR